MRDVLAVMDTVGRPAGRSVADLDLQLRAGIHTGEIERTKADVSGIGVHIAARVMGLAGPDEVVASRTVRDLAAGSGIVFTERGAQTGSARGM